MMDQEKQIEEMALLIHKIMPVGLELSAAVATDLYNAGYRKQSEGEWVYNENGGYVCSVCGCWMEDYYGATPEMMKYCFNCGAKMVRSIVVFNEGGSESKALKGGE